MQEHFETEWGGKKFIIETGKLAGQASGSCTVRYGDTVVLATATISETKREGVDFLPLVIDYEERLYAAGKIKTSRFIKREMRPTDEAVLTGRLIDRSIRPLFNDKIRNDIQVIITVFSFDGENDPDIAALNAASAALMISDIPWEGPIAGVRVGRINGEWVLNPTFAAREKSDLDLVIAGTAEKITMIEAGGQEVPEEVMIEAIDFGQKHLQKILALEEEMAKRIGKSKQNIPEAPASDEEQKDLEETKRVLIETEKILETKLDLIFANARATKAERRELKESLQILVDKHLTDLGFGKEKRRVGTMRVGEILEKVVSQAILKEGKRVDGRGLDDIRPLSAEVGIMPRIHGSSLFSRGETQILSTITLGAPSVEQTLEGMEISGKKRCFHHYNFPPYCVGEVGRMFGPGRREIGHGALAERALLPVIPSKEDFPYTIRIVSEVVSSNGSSSMASVCASSLAMMDAGVPIKKAVAGVAMGLASDKEGKWAVFTDLQDLEDSKGGMDFKTAGTKDGVTVVQMDTKTKGLDLEIIKTAFEKAKIARLKILEVMNDTISAPRPELSPYAPRIVSFRINPEKIRDVIGPGGKVINEIIEKTGVTIDIEQDGLVVITSVSSEAAEKASEWVKNLTREVKVGEVFQGRVTRILDFGAFVEILPKQEGLVHISELEHHRVNKVSDVVSVGDIVAVKVISIDELGRINLSRKALIEPEKQAPAVSGPSRLGDKFHRR